MKDSTGKDTCRQGVDRWCKTIHEQEHKNHYSRGNKAGSYFGNKKMTTVVQDSFTIRDEANHCDEGKQQPGQIDSQVKFCRVVDEPIGKKAY